MKTVPSMCCICASRLDHSCWDDESPGNNAWAWPFFCRQKRDILQKREREAVDLEEAAAAKKRRRRSAEQEAAEKEAARRDAEEAAAAAAAREWEENNLASE